MHKIIPVSAALLLTYGIAYAQNDGTSTTDNTNTTTNPSTTPTTPTTTDSTLTGTNSNATPSAITTPSTSNNMGNMGTNNNMGTSTMTSTPSTTSPTPTTVSTPATPTSTGITGSTNISTSSPNSVPAAPNINSTNTVGNTPAGFICTGSAPEWNLSIAKDAITYSSSKAPNIKLKAVTPTTPAGDVSGNLQAFSAKTDSGKPITILLRKNSSGCSNGASQNFQYDTYIVYDNMLTTGCCNPK
jgi:uncharacterized membrane protein